MLVSALGLWQLCEERLLDAKEIFLPFFEFGHREIFDHFLVSALSFLPGLLHDGEAGVEPQ